MGLFGNNKEVTALRLRVTALEQRLNAVTQALGLPAPPEPVGMAEVRQLKASGEVIPAIKRLRESQPGLGLAEAKGIVDQL